MSILAPRDAREDDVDCQEEVGRQRANERGRSGRESARVPFLASANLELFSFIHRPKYCRRCRFNHERKSKASGLWAYAFRSAFLFRAAMS